MPPLYFDKITLSGGGYMTGIKASLVDNDLIISRCDVAGFFLWQANTKSWKQLLDFPPERSVDWGAGGFTLHPTDPNTFWLSTGSYVSAGQTFSQDGHLYKTIDKGASFTEVTSFPRIAIGGNADWARLSSSRMAVCPSNPNILIHCGYSHTWVGGDDGRGIYRSADGGSTWNFINFTNLAPGQTVNSSVNNNRGQTAIVFDDVNSNVCYVGICGLGVVRSADFGVTWTFIGGSKYIQDAVCYNSVLYCVSSESVESLADDSFYGLTKYQSSSWTAILTRNFGWIAVNRNNGEMSAGWVSNVDSQGKGFWYYSTNQWASNTAYSFGNYLVTTPYFGNSKAPGNEVSGLVYTANSKVFVIDLLRTWRNDNYHATGDTWIERGEGIENTVVYDFQFIPDASNEEQVYGAWYDIFAFNHSARGFKRPPASKIGGLNNSSLQNESAFNISYCLGSPGNIAISTSDYNDPPTTFALHTSDFGVTWIKSSGLNKLSRVCFSSSNPNLIVALQRGNQPVFADGKDSITNKFIWKSFSTGSLPFFAYDASWWTGQPIVADPIDGNSFYCVSDNTSGSNYARLYKFTYSAGNMTAAQVSSLASIASYNPGLPAKLKISDGRIFISYGGSFGLHVSLDNGVNFTRLTSVTECRAFDIGAPKPGSANKTLWVLGGINGVKGIWESNDWGVTWENRMDTALYSPYNFPGSLDLGIELAASQQTYPLIVYGAGGHGARYSSETNPFTISGSSGGGVSSGGIIQLRYNSSLFSSNSTIQMRII